MSTTPVRAEKNSAKTNIPFEVPAGKVLEGRMDACLEIIYLLFKKSYSASKATT